MSQTTAHGLQLSSETQHDCNETQQVGVHQMETEVTMVVLKALIDHPGMFSYIEADIADYLDGAGMFDMSAWTVTAKGRDFVGAHS